MSAKPLVRFIPFVAAALFCSACSVTQPQKFSDQQQQESLSRWYQCIERHRDAHEGSFLDMKREISLGCEGHQRDVLATYPEHLENQVSALLSEHADQMSAEHFLRSSKLSAWNTLPDADNDNLSIRLTGALSDDL